MNGLRVAQHHAMIEFIGDGLGALFKSDKVEDVMIGVQIAFDFDAGAIVVAVQTFALVAFVADEMAAAKDEMVFGDADFIVFQHGIPS